MAAFQMVDMVQLTMRGGLLSLKQPIELRTEPILDLISGLRRFLMSENSERFVFSSKNPDKEMKAELSDKVFRVMERSSYGEQSYVFSFEEQTLMVNNQPADSALCSVFAKKIEQLILDIQEDRVRILMKARRS